MSFETTVRALAAALDDPSAAPPPMALGRKGAPDARRFAVYRNNVAVGLIGALEARYPVSRQIAGDQLFRAMARAFAHAVRPRSAVMIAYGGEFPEFMAAYLAGDPKTYGRVSSPTRAALACARPQALVGEGQGGGSRCPTQEGSRDTSDDSLRDPPPIGRSEERPSRDGLMPALTKGGGCTNGIDSPETRRALAYLGDVARLENAWVEAYHAEDASVATVVELAPLNPDSLPGTRIAFHPAARLLRFATPAASVWASAQNSDGSAALAKGIGEDALITRPDCDVRVCVLPPLAHDFALLLREGATLIEAAAAMNDPAFDFGSHLVGLVESGAVASIVPGRAP
jgi:Putative DNA-binding domain